MYYKSRNYFDDGFTFNIYLRGVEGGPPAGVYLGLEGGVLKPLLFSGMLKRDLLAFGERRTEAEGA
jgi:hypothetical protein